MTIKLDIPENILSILKECGYSKPQCANIFKTFLIQVMSGWYGEFETDFDLWLEEQGEEKLNEIKEGKLL